MKYKNAEPIKELLAECVDDEALAEALGVCVATVHRRVKQGKLPFMRNGPKKIFHVPTIIKLMTDGEAA